MFRIKESTVSLVTPCYNSEKWLLKTIESIRKQSFLNIQYIVADGASTDSSLKILGENQDVVTYVISEPDSGPAEALKRGLAVATGDYFGFINADDRLCELAVEEAVARLSLETGPALVFRDIIFIDGNGRPTVGYGGKLKHYCPSTYSPLHHRNGIMVVPQQGSFWNRAAHELVGPFDVEIATCFDGDWFARATVAGVKMIYLPGVAAEFRIHCEAISSNPKWKDQWVKDRLKVEETWKRSGIPRLSGVALVLERIKRIALRSLRHINVAMRV